MSKFKIVPTNIKTGAVAPYFVEDISNENDVEKVASKLSPLFADTRWQPSISKLPNYNLKTFK